MPAYELTCTSTVTDGTDGLVRYSSKIERTPMHVQRTNFKNKKHLKNVGPIRYCEPPLYCQSPGVASRTPAITIAQAACDVHDNNNNNDNA